MTELAPRYRLRYGNIRDGRIYGPLPGASASGSAGMLGEGSVSISVPAGERTPAIYRALPPGKGMWVLEWDDGQTRRVVDAGTLWNRGVAGDSLSYGGAGIMALLNTRLLIQGVASSSVATSTVTFTGLDHGSIMRGIVAQVQSLFEGDLPIVLEAPRAGTRTRTYDGFDLAMAGQRITELAEVQPRTEFLLAPRFKAGVTTHVEWDMLTGTEDTPQLTNVLPLRLNATTPGQQIVGEITVDDSAADLATYAWSKGAGEETKALIRAAENADLTGAGWPRMDRVTTSESEDPDLVQSYAIGLLMSALRPARGVKVQVRASWWWAQAARVGDRVHLTADHRVIGRLDFTSRVLEVAWDISSQWVTLTLADTLAEEGF